MLLFLVCAGLAAAPLLYQRIGERRDARRFPPPGELIDVGALRLHVYRQGKGSPAVILEAGIAGSLLGWTLVQPRVAEFTCAVSYDRAGLGWSGRCGSARTLDGMVADLAQALTAARIPGPYILTGHSFGGLLIRAFAQARPGEVAGLVFVDPVTICGWAEPEPEQLRRLETGARLSRRGGRLARWGVVRGALAGLTAGGKWLPKVVARSTAGQGLSTLERLLGEVRRLPAEVHPWLRAHWSRSQSFEAMAAYLECLPECARQALKMPIAAEIPFIVLSAGNATAAELAEREAWVAASKLGRHVQAPGTGHWLQLERPEIVVEAVRELVDRYNNDR